jgi:hypothetical protein
LVLDEPVIQDFYFNFAERKGKANLIKGKCSCGHKFQDRWIPDNSIEQYYCPECYAKYEIAFAFDTYTYYRLYR